MSSASPNSTPSLAGKNAWARFDQWGRSSRGLVILSLLSMAFAWGSFLTYYEVWFDLNEPPATSGDEPDYDSLGWELSHGRGYQVNTDDPEFRRPYDAAATASDRFQLGHGHHGPITYRPPLFPMLIAGSDLAFGRQFWSIRVFNSGCMAATCGITVAFLLSRWGVGPALIASCLFVVVDPRSRLYGRAILTEALSAFLVAVLVAVLWQQTRRRGWIWPALAGVVFGLAILGRSLFILWLPGLIFVVGFIAWRTATSRRILYTGLSAGLFLAVTLLMLVPWGVRNCQLLGTFMPLGTQGTSQLSAAFGDEAWAARGAWVHLEKTNFFDGVLRDDMTLLERELATARVSGPRALQWIQQHPAKAIALVPLKILQEFRPRTWGEGIVLLLALIGAVISRRDVISQICLVLLAINCVAIGATWSVEGRFLVPLLFAFHYWAAIGAWTVVRRLVPRID
ncbi:ArnT family glycosyltransferase [Planctomicrobium piriforme]|uniref:Dolichyl-phosphate-mannose-protein mannosyltransferase n=1 Tax=Planctomicrobium piriforme TaxID=1576369 RepID=A0A1I3T7K3_9PLAN|nr:glycosyltransferase family 39 protein [Planctomicrobium piriforme]SFJ66472.1 Dolichyl-phosphate-mannose-protein mannosyltransferase [Planctomicrobium piriforme]